MSQPPPPPITLEGPQGPISVVVSEASPTQRLPCRKLGAVPFGAPLQNEADYVQLDEYLGAVPLTRDDGWRFWCLALTADPARVLATCKTVRRRLLVRDADVDAGAVRERRAYCLASVVTDPEYRGYGLATLLLRRVAAWMDGPGGGVACLLYTSIKEVRAGSAYHVSHTAR